MTLNLPWQIQKRKTRWVIFFMMEWHAHEREVFSSKEANSFYKKCSSR